MKFKIKQAEESDIFAITELFYETIQTVNSKDYPQDEIDDWSSWHKDTDRWTEEIEEQYFIVAIFDGVIVGFASLAKNGYLDFLFVHKDFQGQGIASLLLVELEKKAKGQKNQKIYSEVSVTARTFFEKHGFVVEREQLKKSREKELKNYYMTKKMI